MSDSDIDSQEMTLTGTLFAGKFDVVDRIGEGGMGNVYRARHLPTGEWVALKRLHPEHASDEEVTARFNREMEATANIRHENTVRVVDYGESDGSLYLAMELIEGRSLDDVLIDDAPLPASRVADIGRQIASALVAAHERNFVHRDLKPENIMLTVQDGVSDFVKVLDFGLAALIDDSKGARLTAQGLRVGTPLFMAPEYIEGTQSDHRGDLYALGVVMYMLVVGKAPFLGSGYKLLTRAVTEIPIPPSEQPSGCEPWLESIILRLMEKKPGKRIQTAEEVERLLTSRQAVTLFPFETDDLPDSSSMPPALSRPTPASMPPQKLLTPPRRASYSPPAQRVSYGPLIIVAALVLGIFGFAIGIFLLWPVLYPS
jgi:serine/threonine-protein kinase